MTFYLKYRPQTIDELDLEKVRKQLKEALAAKSVPHAFLFSGSRGLGKTSAARIVAKVLNCEIATKNRKDTIEPCNTCEACISITKGSSPDVIEVDGASNRGIDDIRTLRETVSLAPMRLQKKVYIIDEVHMLTKEAFNALLKTLEEPPSHVVFILATTEPNKVPETIQSRSFHVQFQRASETELVRSLSRVVTGEKLDVEAGVLEHITTRTRGGFRDSVKLLEQLAFGSKTITVEQFEATFGQDQTEQFLEFLFSSDAVKALEWIKKQETNGADFTNIFRNILEQLQAELLRKLRKETSKYETIDQTDIIEMITICMQAASEQKATLIETLPLELLVAKWVGKDSSKPSNVQNTKPAKKLEDTPGSDNLITKKPKNQKINIPNSGLSEKQKSTEISISETSSVKSKSAESQAHDITKPKKETSPKLTISIDQIKSKWDAVLQEVKPKNRSLESLLRGSVLSLLEGDILTITVYYGLHKQQLESDKYLKIVESVFYDMFGVKLKLQYVLGDKSEKQIIDTAKDHELEKNVEEIFS